ncbi:MAG: hypothetical protein ACE5E9_11330 [Nitrospinaceae bacterium]
MDKEHLLQFWRDFFTDLFVGSFIKLTLLSLAGFALGMAALAVFQQTGLADLEWPSWLETLILVCGFFWYGGFGVFHGLIASVIHIAGNKLREMVGGLHGLLDLLTREVIAKFPKFSKTIPKEELARQFDNIGEDFRAKLRLKRGITGLAGRVLFGTILKALKFFFLDDVAEELAKKPSNQITSSDIEHAVRRVGVEMVLSPITDNLILIQILNAVLIILAFALPFGILALF